MGKILWKGNQEDLPKEYAEQIVETYNKRVKWLNENPCRWFTKEKYPRKYYRISEPFETYDFLPKRPYISQESETVDVDYNKEKLWETFCINEEEDLWVNFESNISRSYYESHGDIYEPTGKVEITKYNDN